jgi:hypothetical protein
LGVPGFGGGTGCSWGSDRSLAKSAFIATSRGEGGKNRTALPKSAKHALRDFAPNLARDRATRCRVSIENMEGWTMLSQQEQAIQERAYAIWEEEDRPDGKALDHWLRAEAENTATRMTNSIDTDLEEFLSALEPLIRDIRHLTWENAPPPMFEIVCCAAICRQFEAIQASKDMTRRDTGHFGVLFLRAACEELIWIRYLNSIDPKMADIITHCLVQKEIHDLVNGQEQFSGRNSLINGGFSPKFLNDQKDTSKQAHTLLKSIGVKLKWPTSPLPTVAFLARRTGST